MTDQHQPSQTPPAPPHELGTRHYVLVWIALLGLTGLSWAVSYAGLGALDVAVALAIATVKSALVLLFFMHLVHERFTTRLVPLVAVTLIALLVGLTVLDVRTRMTSSPAPDPALTAPAAAHP